MIQAFPHPALLYAAQPLPGVAPGARPAYAAQSAAAEKLAQSLRAAAPGGPVSKAHARGCVAAAAATEGVLGIDLEYRQPGRDIGAIALWLMGAPARDELSAYRMFTYREAYFKALGAWPAVALLRFVAEEDARDFQTPDGLNVLSEPIGEAFVLTLVWNSAASPRRL